MTAPASRADSDASGAASDEGSSARRRTLLWPVAFAVSAVLHLLAIALYPGLVAPPEVTTPPPSSTAPETAPEGIEIVNIEEVAPEPIQEPEEPETERQPVPVPVTAPEPAEAEATEEEGALEPDETLVSAAEAIRLDSADVDERLWTLDEEITRLPPSEIEEFLLSDRIYAWLDSMNAAAARAEAAKDWTFTDDEGKKWGVSEGKLHLGDLTLPLPFSFGQVPWNVEDEGRRAFEIADIQRGALTSAIRETIEERAAAIRERRDRERAALAEERRKARAEADSARADTTRAGGGGGSGDGDSGGEAVRDEEEWPRS